MCRQNISMVRPNAGIELVERADSAVAKSRDRDYVWHPWSPISADRARLMISGGSGYCVWDIDGKEYIDAASLNTTCGYGHPDVVAAIVRQASTLQGVDISVASHDVVGDLAERLASYLPEQLSRTLFVNSGSEGFDAALMIATGYWSNLRQKRDGIVTFARGYHGSTIGSRSLSALPRVGHPFGAFMPVAHVELPVEPSKVRDAETLPLLLRTFEQAISSLGGVPLAIVVEPFLNVGGGIVLPDGLLIGVRELCDRYQTLLVLDEVFTAYGRCGHMFACNRERVAPDILVSSKGLAGGYMPIAAVTVRQAIYESFREDALLGGLRYGHTTSGHAVACAAALATLDLIEREELLAKANRFGQKLRDRFTPLIGHHDVVDVRGIGLVVVIEMTSFEIARDVVARAESLGLLLRQPGEALMMVPALTIDDVGVQEAAHRLEQAILASPD